MEDEGARSASTAFAWRSFRRRRRRDRRGLPLCMIMLEDARGAMGAENLVIRDAAEIVADGLVTD